MKFFIKDEDGTQYEVEELKEETVTDESSLTEEDISALKKLASVADKLVSLVNTEDSDVDEDIDNENDEDITDSDEEDKDEKVVTTDSKRSVGAIEKKAKIEDSSLNENYEIEQAWAKRFNGGK